MNGKKICSVVMFSVLVLAGAQAAAVDIGDYTATPAFVSRSVRPNVMFIFSNDHTNFYVGFRGLSDYNNGFTYYGYFDPNKCYKYDDTNKYFYTDDAWNAFNHYTMDSTGREADGSNTVAQKDMWSGNFLNWLTMCHGDFVRKTLTGGRVSATDNSTYWILERGEIPDDSHKWTKTYAPSSMTNPDVGALIPYAPYVAATYTPVYPTESNRTFYFDFDTWNTSTNIVSDVAPSDSVSNNGTAKCTGSGCTRPTKDTGTNKFYGTASARFDGVDDYIEVADQDEVSAFGGNLTVEFWMRRESNDNDELIIGNGGTGSNNGFAVVSKNGGRIRFNLWRTGGSNSDSGILDSVKVPTNNAWHYIVCTYDKSVDTDGDAATPVVGVMRIFIDGCLDAESATEFNGDIGNSTGSLGIGIGLQAPYNTKYFHGRLDELSLWKETLSSTMVRSRY